MAERLFYMCVWNSVSVFVSLIYLTGSVIKPTIITVFVLVSCLLGFGQRWLLPAGFGLSMVAVAVALGLPSPEHWPPFASTASHTFNDAWFMISSAVR